MSEFIPGLQLSEMFYREAVKPVLEEYSPGLPHSAALIGYGSETLGFDTERSMDHGWGPRVILFLEDSDVDAHGPAVKQALAKSLPRSFRGFPTHFVPSPHDGVPVMQGTASGPISHSVQIHSVSGFFISQIGCNPLKGMTTMDWISIASQRLREATDGAVYHDGLGTLTEMRRRLEWYPEEIWRTLMAAQWQRIAQEEAFVGRCGEVGDELGSAIVAGRLVRELIRLCFLLERKYAPYTKWLGTAFARLTISAALGPTLTAVMHASDWHTRERRLISAYEAIAEIHNGLGITTVVEPRVSTYFGRPFNVINAHRFKDALTETLSTSLLKEISCLGSVDQFVDSTDVTQNCQRMRRLTNIYGASWQSDSAQT
jgi:hypothetical protein